MSGPVPKRSDQRRRTNSDGPPITRAAAGEREPAPEPDPEWHATALRWYSSLARSGQSVYYEASDWATAYYVAEAMSKNLSQGKFSAVLFGAVMTATTSLLATEGDRRRLRLELTAPEVENTNVDDEIFRLVAELEAQPDPQVPAEDTA